MGFGDIGPDASKPVMEGKALLFKIFAGIDEDLPLHVELPSSAQSIASAMFGGKLASRMGDQGDKNLRKSWEYPR